MTVQELINMLEDLDGETEVRLMTQEAWPFENAIAGIALASEMGGENDEEKGGYRPPFSDADVLYLVEGEQLGYGTKSAWSVCRRH
jgi:hypothetical protein